MKYDSASSLEPPLKVLLRRLDLNVERYTSMDQQGLAVGLIR
jgi:hypothetical protein